MEFKVYQKELELQSRGWIPTFHDVTKEVGNIVTMSAQHLQIHRAGRRPDPLS